MFNLITLQILCWYWHLADFKWNKCQGTCKVCWIEWKERVCVKIKNNAAHFINSLEPSELLAKSNRCLYIANEIKQFSSFVINCMTFLIILFRKKWKLDSTIKMPEIQWNAIVNCTWSDLSQFSRKYQFLLFWREGISSF